MSAPTPNAPSEMQQFEALLTKRDVLLLPYSDSQSEAWERADIALRAFVASLAKDKARLDWLESEVGGENERVPTLDARAILFARGTSLYLRNEPITRAAIDGAMTGVAQT